MTDRITLQPSQAADLDTLRRNGWIGLLNIQMGYGKTIVAIAAAIESRSRVVLVVGPDSTFEGAWLKTVKTMTGKTIRRIANGKKADREAKADFLLGYEGWYFTTPQFLTRDKDIADWSGDMLIADEAHQLSAAKSKGQRRLSGFHHADGVPLSRRFRYRLALSGTPARNNFERLWATMRFLWPDLEERGQVAYHNFHVWESDRMTSRSVYTNQRDRNGNVKQVKQFLTEAQPGRLLSEAPCVVQHFRRETCCQFHPGGFLSLSEPQVLRHTVHLLPEQKRAIAELEEQYLTWLEANPLIVELPLTLHQRVRQVALGVPTVDEEGNVSFADDCKSPVIDAVLERMEVLGPDENVVVYLDSQKFAAVLVKRLNQAGIPAFEYSGATTATRGQHLAEFTSGQSKWRVCVGTIASLSTGTDGLQNVAKTEFWLQRSLDETNNFQGEARLDRHGQQSQVQRILFSDDLNMFEGQLSQAIERRLALAKSLRKAA